MSGRSPFDKLRTSVLLPFVLSLSKHERKGRIG
jgi:hypothetical protein